MPNLESNLKTPGELFKILPEKKWRGETRRANLCREFRIYPPCCFQQLINDAGAHPDAKKNKFRFLVDIEHQLWFALEGTVSPSIPGHFQMTDDSDCLSAGNITINEKNEIIKINHKSGDFKPAFECLAHALAILTHNQGDNSYTLAESISIEKLTQANVEECVYQIKRTALDAWATPFNKYVQETKEVQVRTVSPPERKRPALYSGVAGALDFSPFASAASSSNTCPSALPASPAGEQFQNPNKKQRRMGLFHSETTSSNQDNEIQSAKKSKSARALF